MSEWLGLLAAAAVPIGVKALTEYVSYDGRTVRRIKAEHELHGAVEADTPERRRLAEENEARFQRLMLYREVVGLRGPWMVAAQWLQLVALTFGIIGLAVAIERGEFRGLADVGVLILFAVTGIFLSVPLITGGSPLAESLEKEKEMHLSHLARKAEKHRQRGR